jgi:hypothetical protein
VSWSSEFWRRQVDGLFGDKIDVPKKRKQRSVGAKAVDRQSATAEMSWRAPRAFQGPN